MIGSKIKNIKERIKDENGLVIVEATIVFPVMLFVLFFIIFIGNLYYEQAKVDDIVLRAAIKGSQCVADPFEYEMLRTGVVPDDVTKVDVKPYRYIFGDLKDIEDKISAEVSNQIANGSLVFFSNSQAKVIGSDQPKIAKYNNKILFSSFSVQVNYQIKFPIRFIGENNPTILTLSSRAEVSVNDVPEFIRNVDMAVDLLDGTKAGDTVKGIFDKINSFISKFS